MERIGFLEAIEIAVIEIKKWIEKANHHMPIINEDTGNWLIWNLKDEEYVETEYSSKGEKGADGISCTHSWDGTTLTITSAYGTSSANLKGDKGDSGATGANGKSAYASAQEGGYIGTESEFYAALASVQEVIGSYEEAVF